MYQYYLGIDNGLNGAIVVLDDQCNIKEKTIMPIIKIDGKSNYDINSIIQWFQSRFIEPEKVFVTLEKSHVRPISGSRASFMTGYGYGLMQAILECMGFSYEIVSPQAWMKELSINSKDTKGSILFAQRRWPNENWKMTDRCKNAHDGLTDASCIALYGYRRYSK